MGQLPKFNIENEDICHTVVRSYDGTTGRKLDDLSFTLEDEKLY